MIGRPLRVLIVDDDRDTVEALEGVLSDGPMACEVERAYNGRDALARMRQRRPDLLILDVHMPVMDGLALREQMIRDLRLFNVRVAVFSGYPITDLEHRVLMAEHYLNKPVPVEKLMEILGDAAEAATVTDKAADAAALARVEEMIADLTALRDELRQRLGPATPDSVE